MPKLKNLSGIAFWFGLFLLALAGGYLIFYSTAIAPWAFSDSTVYIASGINWIKGQGMGFVQSDGRFAALTHYPPGYPALLGLTSLLLPDVITAARWIDIFSFALLIFLGGLLLYRITNSRILPILYDLLLLFSPFLITPFSSVMSEAPAILTGTLAILILIRFRQTNRWHLLLLAGLLSAAAVLIRYQQIAVLLTGGIFLLFISHQAWKKRFKDTLLYALFSAGPFLAWLLGTILTSPNNEPRAIGLRGSVVEISKIFIANTYNTVKYWFPWRTGLLPLIDASTARFLLGALFVLFIAFAAWQWRRQGKKLKSASPIGELILACGIYIFANLLVLWAAMLIATPPPDVDNRMLSPLLPILFILLLGVEYLVGKAFKRQWWINTVMIFTAALFILTFAPQEKDYLVTMHYGGEGFTSSVFQNSTFIEKIREQNDQHPIITNSPALVQFFTLKDPYRVFNGKEDPAIQKTTRYGDADTPTQVLFREECAALVIFDPDIAYRFNPESALYFPEEAHRVTQGLTEIYSDELGKIFLYPGCK